MKLAEQHRSTERVLDILELVAQDGRPHYTLTQISQRLDAPKSSQLPILRTLHQRGYLFFEESSATYSIGFKAYEIGTGYIRNGSIDDDIILLLRDITRGCAEASHFAKLNEGDVFYLFKEDSSESIRMFSSPGKRLPAYSTGLGKALLCEKAPEELHALYPNGLYAVTEHTITDMDRLLGQLAEVRQTGFAYEIEESTDFIRCIAVPIRVDGCIRAALSVAVPVFRYTREKEIKIKELLENARGKLESLFEKFPWPYN